MSKKTLPRFKFWLNVVAFLAVAVVLFLARRDILVAVEKLRHLNLWVLALMLPMQGLAFYAVSRVLGHYFTVTGGKLSQRVLFKAVVELNFVNHIFPSGGVSGFSYLTLRLKQYGISSAKSTLAHLMRFMLAFVSFIILLLVAVIMLAIENKANGVIIFLATTLTLSILFGTLVLVYVIGSINRIKQFAHAISRAVNWVLHVFRRAHPESINLKRVEKTFEELHTDYLLLRKDVHKMWPALGWALAANVFEVATVYVAFVAHGAWINPGAVIIAYALATITGLVAIFPGGLGVYEPVMVATLIAAGVSGPLALSATLVSRVVTLTIALITGYLFYHKALRNYDDR